MALLMLIVGFSNGAPSPFDGTYLKEYDPNRDGLDPDGKPMLAHVVVTHDPALAQRFESMEDFHRTWTLVDERRPLRSDGKPNRPLTAFTVTTVNVED